MGAEAGDQAGLQRERERLSASRADGPFPASEPGLSERARGEPLSSLP
jgi:hypothetical protein